MSDAVVPQSKQTEATQNQVRVEQARLEPKKRLALLALLQLVVLIGSQSIGKVMHVLCPCIGVKWAKDHKDELQKYALTSAKILERMRAKH